MRFAPRWVCIISYCGCMSYGVHFSANRLGGLKKVCVTGEYALSRLWVMRESTVPWNEYDFTGHVFLYDDRF
jgi:hypothetical protein